VASSLAVSATPARAPAIGRLAFLDQIRGVLTLLVVLHHTAITYGGAGDWYYREATSKGGVASTLLILFCAINQAYFMGAFFLIAGYVTPPSLERKGAGRFVRDRLVRLGVPLLVYMLLIDALTNAIAQAGRGGRFGEALAQELLHGGFGPGPLWFVEALLLFSAAYAGWRWLKAGPPRADDAPLPAHRNVLAAILVTGLAAFALRLWMPVGRELAHLQLGYFASYVVLFAIGCMAWRHRWLERIEWTYARPWWVVTLIALPVLPVAAVAHDALTHTPVAVAGGVNVWALLYALWEPVVACGVLLALLWLFRTRVDATRLHALGRRAYAIYCFHPPVVVAVSVALHAWAAPALLKFAVAGMLSCALLYVLAGWLLRVPLVARVW
jgi:fucose 4-O-acetylase-like acetyltransferase